MDKILIANRGEIAVRVITTCKRMGITTVAVYSEADRMAPHVMLADEAYLLGPAPSSQSYLLGEKIIRIALDSHCEGIHPGYGFLSENANFAKKVTDSGLIFIGPDPYAIEVMGSKLAAKETVKNYDIPMVPGIDQAITNITAAKEVADKIGYPILIKASAGGGGKGMRIVQKEAEFEGQMERAISEAQSSFGDGSVFLEKYVSSPRHIEIQILADRHGNILYLFERECSVQRRHQKVIEEAPSSILTPQLRKQMGNAAVDVARSCKYVGAGTVEFLMDDQLNFYFLEMNTRLQVEHPVTEMITGVDLVEQQIKIARGEVLNISQNDLKINGHAIELRVYAEDPLDNFMPSIGTLTRYHPPRGVGIRVDDGYYEGMAIPIHYDPMIAKLVVHDHNRESAIRKLIQAIEHYEIDGIETTLSFGTFVAEHDAFRSGNFDTHFVKNYYSADQVASLSETTLKDIAMIGHRIFELESKRLRTPVDLPSNWQSNRT